MTNHATTPQSAEIQRYELIISEDHINGATLWKRPRPDGKWVKHADCEAAIARLSEELQQAKADLCAATMEAESLPAQSAFDQVKAERDQWKANHDNAVAIKKAVLERPDLGDRAPRVVALTVQLSAALAERDAIMQRILEAIGESWNDWWEEPVEEMIDFIKCNCMTSNFRDQLMSERDAALAEVERVMGAIDERWFGTVLASIDKAFDALGFGHEVDDRDAAYIGEEVAKRIATLTTIADGWTKSLPNRQDTYWHWNGDPDSAPLPWHVLYGGCGCAYFVSAGQYGQREAIACKDMGGWWKPCPTPKTPEANQ